MNPSNRNSATAFALPLSPIILVGAIITATFYGLILAGPLDFDLLKRYCLSHPVAVAAVSLFFVGVVNLSIKWRRVSRQFKANHKAASALQRLVTEGSEIAAHQRVEWLKASWEALPFKIQHSWLGTRLSRALQLQLSRGRRHQLEQDLTSLAEFDADQQHESYALPRIINWAMPMLGFLGTVLGISRTLGQLDTQMLATQQQDAMNQLTAGLYVAFDTTAIALVLTVFSMFVQFAVSRRELALLERVDRDAQENLVHFLASDPHDAQNTLVEPIREMANELISAVKQITEDQSAIWARSIAESQRQWSAWTETASHKAEDEIADRIDTALTAHSERLQKLYEEASRQVEVRWQQWQTTLSDQARTLHGQQKEIIRQSDSLQELLNATTDLRKLEDTIHDSIARLENIHRLEEATLCVGEAVAVMATSLERAGVIRGTPTRPRATRTADDELDSKLKSAMGQSEASSGMSHSSQGEATHKGKAA